MNKAQTVWLWIMNVILAATSFPPLCQTRTKNSGSVDLGGELRKIAVRCQKDRTGESTIAAQIAYASGDTSG